MSSSNNADDDGIQFECRTCREEAHQPCQDDLSEWAKLCGYDSSCIRLCREQDERALETIQINPKLIADHQFIDAAPEAGKSYIARVSHPFIAQKAESFWFLFQPPFTLENGWEENPEEIYYSHLVHAVLDGVLHRDKHFALIIVTVQEMICISSIHVHFPETTDAGVFAKFDEEFARRANSVRWLNYVYVYWNLESDVGVWWLFRQDQPLGREPARLVMQGHWGWHDALIWAGNHRLSTAETAHLNAFMLR